MPCNKSELSEQMVCFVSGIRSGRAETSGVIFCDHLRKEFSWEMAATASWARILKRPLADAAFFVATTTV